MSQPFFLFYFFNKIYLICFFLHILCHAYPILHAVYKVIEQLFGHVSALSMCASMTTPQLHWKKVCASACSIDHSSTASLCTSTVPERLVEQQTRTAEQWPRIPDPLPSPSAIASPLVPWPPKIPPCSSVWMSHVAFGPPAQVRLFGADCFKVFCLHRQKIGGVNLLESSRERPLWHFAHSWLAPSLILHLRKDFHL